jgi:hypothetical protein
MFEKKALCSACAGSTFCLASTRDNLHSTDDLLHIRLLAVAGSSLGLSMSLGLVLQTQLFSSLDALSEQAVDVDLALSR